jgi:hypothetical protein
MNPRDIPPNVFINSFLDSAAKVAIEATVIYTVEKNGKRKTSAVSNKGPEGIARAANVLKFGDGSVERAAIALHEFRITFKGDTSELPEDVLAEMKKCFICRESVPWDKLDEPDRHGHRELAKAAIAAALMGAATTPPTTPLVSV